MTRVKVGPWTLAAIDSRNWALLQERRRERGKRAGEVYDDVYGYYPRLEGALDALLELHLKEADAKTMKELREEISRFRRRLNAALEGDKTAFFGPRMLEAESL